MKVLHSCGIKVYIIITLESLLRTCKKLYAHFSPLAQGIAELQPERLHIHQGFLFTRIKCVETACAIALSIFGNHYIL